MVDGLVVDSLLAPLDGAIVSVVGTAIEARTGASGRFRILRMPSGVYQLRVIKLGYEPLNASIELRDDDTTRITLTLRIQAVQLRTTVVTAPLEADRLRGFEYRRQHSIGGRFISQEDIAKQAPVQATDLLRRIMGLNLLDSAGVLVAASSRGSKTAIIQGRLVAVPCVMPVMINGLLADPQHAINSIPPSDIHGIEIYLGPSSIPPEFNGARADTFCGLIVIWTRSG